MEWIHQFYEKQFQLMKGNGSGIEANHEEKLNKVETFADRPFRSILELGAGSGEFSVTAAKRGYNVTAVELVPTLVKHMRKLQQEYVLKGKLSTVCDDFYQLELSETYDVVCYLDGFGIGGDQDQRRLLKRISEWLNSDGCALIDIYTPWYWSSNAGQEMKFGSASRKYNYDFAGSRMLDTWFDSDNKQITQSLKCYSPKDLQLLLETTGLKLVDIQPGGAMDYETWEYWENAPLGEAMSYMAKLVKG
ncbi:cyclopropane fatty-acyl-phospholipid synthase-like methyltransferase [Virgibacillus natechei]|uniref:Cyclopropane fatty-acyl-phospholipid synthase-like methyltransferase n=1 Tax=Virgibacillus natechei TaxID=1216297 RepID=A0ABS4IH68_9BACI|nr:class I SAM-dependent methyltransferase [Virgibacillus natechei]MBP1970287.1 cyclopropane fatty-acyl-phospholipid synthase-like methyltransferase [Virgibacillus natechei]UZD13115.1 class I SAM-dependent methyltransferase [Virgibacillus natechei]